MRTGAECFFPFLVVVIVLLFVAINAHSRKSALNEAFERLASHYGGRAQAGGLLDMPSAMFIARGTLVRVDIFAPGGQRSQRFTQVHLGWPDPKFCMDVHPSRFWNQMGHLVGMQGIQLNSPQFDDEYRIRGSDVSEVRLLLAGPVQLQINVLRRFLGNDDVYVGISCGQLLVKKLSLIRDANQLIRFVEMALELRSQALLTQTDGIEFEDDSKAQPIDSPTCQVCGEEIGVDMVICRRCKTPHHRDCWQYFGRCSTYGCGEPRFYLPKTARALPPDSRS